MLIIDLLSWWYSRGWILRVRAVGEKLGRWAEYFSFGIILRTLFSPWRQMVSQPGPDQPLYVKKDAFIDNLVSRTVGFGVRLIVMLAGVITLLLVGVFYIVLVVLWPLLPLSPGLLPVLGVML